MCIVAAVRRNKTTPPPASPAVGLKSVTKTERFVEPIEDKTERQTITIPAEVIEEEEPLDRFEAFFQQVREQQGWTLLVYRLNSFHKDGKTALRGNTTYIGRIPFDPDTYLDDIQAMCPEGGAFQLQAKDPDAHFSQQWKEEIAPVKSPKTAAANTHYFIQQAPNGEPAPAPRDTLKEFLGFASTAKEIKQAFGWDHEPPQAVQATPVTATVEPPPLHDRIIEAALNAALKTERPETITGLLRDYIGAGKDDFSWKEIIAEVVKPLIPLAGGLLSAYMQSQSARAQATVQTSAQPQNPQQPALPPMQPVTQSPPVFVPALEIPQNANPYDTFAPGSIAPVPAPSFAPQPEPEQPYDEEEEADMGRDDLVYKLAEMLEECVRRAASDPVTIEQGRLEVVAFKQRFPVMTGTVDALTTLPPEAIIGMLALKVPEVAAMINNDVAKQTIRDFQEALKRPN